MKKIKILAIVGAVLLAIAYIASPYVAASSFGSAVASRDAAGVSEKIDFPILRDSIKTGFKAEIAKKMATTPKEEGGVAAMGAVFAGAMLDQMVDAYVTPTGIQSIMEKAAPTAGSADKGKDLEYDTEYRSLDRFAIVVRSKTADDGRIALVMHRHGLFSWKVSEIEIPLDKLGASLKGPTT